MSKTTNKFSPEVRERAVRLVLDNQDQHESRWQAILSISSKIGCAPPGRALRSNVPRGEDHRADHGVAPICRMLPIAPATFYDHLAKRADPSRLSDRAVR